MKNFNFLKKFYSNKSLFSFSSQNLKYDNVKKSADFGMSRPSILKTSSLRFSSMTKSKSKNSFMNLQGKISLFNSISNLLNQNKNLFRTMKCQKSSKKKKNKEKNEEIEKNKNNEEHIATTFTPHEIEYIESKSAQSFLDEHNLENVKVYFFGNEDISLPTLSKLKGLNNESLINSLNKLLIEAKANIAIKEFKNYEGGESENINKEEENEENFLSSVFEHKKEEPTNLFKTLNISEIEVVTTPWGHGNKTQAKFHTFLNKNNISHIDIVGDDNWQPLLSSIKNSNKNHEKKVNNVNETEDTFKLFNSVMNKLQNQSQKCLGLILSFGKKIPDEVIDAFHSSGNLGIYVIHPSLLPKYRGGAPIQHTLLNKEKETGVSLIFTSKGKFDAGDILLQRKIDIQPYQRFLELSGELGVEGSGIAEDFLSNYYLIMDNFNTKKKVKETSNEKQPFAKIIKDKNFCYLNFVEENSQSIINIYKAFYGSQMSPWAKSAYGIHKKLIFFDNLFIPRDDKIEKIEKSLKTNLAPGSVYWDFKLDVDYIYIKTVNSWIISDSIKLEGYPTLKPLDFVKTCLKGQKFDKQTKQTYLRILPNEIEDEKKEMKTEN